MARNFEAKRKTARYCSARCRKLAFHGEVSVPNGTDNPLSVPEMGVSVPGSPDVGKIVNQNATLDIVTDVSQVNQAIEVMLTKKQARDRDNRNSLSFDRSEEGFARRNKNWHDFSGETRESIRACAESMSMRLKATRSIW